MVEVKQVRAPSLRPSARGKHKQPVKMLRHKNVITI